MSNAKIIQIVNNINSLIKATGEDLENIDDFLQLWMSDDVQEKLGDVVKNKKLKDPNAPKKPPSAYVFFCRDKRDEVKEEHPDMTAREITSELSRLWHELSDKKKAKYLKAVEEDKKRYEDEMESYQPPSEEELKEVQKPKKSKSKKAAKEKKERVGPKKPTTAFLYFSKDMRAKVKEDNPEMSGRDITKELGRLWKEDYADDESREKWVALYQVDKERYESEKSASGSSAVEESKSDSESEKPKKKKAKKAKKSDDAESEIEDDE